MNRARDFAEEIRSVFPGRTPREIAINSGLKIVHEKPVLMNGRKRISEYRPKTKEIVIFFKEHEDEAIAHELFHYLEDAKSLRPDRKRSEEQARVFAKSLLK